MLYGRTIAAALLAMLTAVHARAGEWRAGGYVFSDELGGFEIRSVSGKGSVDDPVVIVQHFGNIEPSILAIRRETAPSGTILPGHSGAMQLALVSIVINGSGRTWAGFDLELQEQFGKPSVYLDGLSFDQMKLFGGRTFQSDRFELFTDLKEPYDRIRFEKGFVNHGDKVEFSYFVTDVTPTRTFFILQEPKVLSAMAPATGMIRRAEITPSPRPSVRPVWRHRPTAHYRSRAVPNGPALGRNYSGSRHGTRPIERNRSRRQTASSAPASES